MQKKGICPCDVQICRSFHSQSKGFIETSPAGYPISGLHRDHQMAPAETTCRYKRVLQAGWSSRRPFTGIRKDHYSFSAYRWSLHGLFMGFTKTSPDGDSANGLYEVHFQAHAKAACRKEKKEGHKAPDAAPQSGRAAMPHNGIRYQKCARRRQAHPAGHGEGQKDGNCSDV